MFTVKTQHIGQVDTVKEPTAKIAHEEKVHAQAEQVKNNNKHHENVINQKQFERPTVWIDMMIFRFLVLRHAVLRHKNFFLIIQ